MDFPLLLNLIFKSLHSTMELIQHTCKTLMKLFE